MRRLRILAWGFLSFIVALSGFSVTAQETTTLTIPHTDARGQIPEQAMWLSHLDRSDYGSQFFPASQPVTTTLTILDVDYENQFPDMTVYLRYLDAQANPIQDVTEFDVSVGGHAVTTPVSVATEQGPLAVAIVADLSTRMDDQGTPFKPTRFADMKSLLQEQILALQLPKLQASLVVLTDTVNVYSPLSDNIGGLRNIINGTVEGLPFALPSAESSSDAYPLEEAVLTALEQLAPVSDTIPRALFVFAAGDPALALDMERIQQAVDAASSDDNRLDITVVGFGSDQEGMFRSFPANPTLLRQLATENDGTSFQYFATDIDTTSQLQTDIKSHFEHVLQLADYYTLEFKADPTLVGTQEVQVQVENVSATRSIDIAAIPPRVRVVVDSRDFQGNVRLRVMPEFVQNSLDHVEYLLNNHLIGESDTSPDFAFDIDAYSDEFQQQFPAGEYELVAAVRDAQGLASWSEPLVVNVFQRPPPASLWEWVLDGVTGFVGIVLVALVSILAVVGAVIYIAKRRHSRRTSGRRFSTTRQSTGKYSNKISEDDQLTGEVDPDITKEFSPENSEMTQLYDGELTQRFSITSIGPKRHFRIVVEQGLSDDARTVFSLRNNGSHHYAIGRPTADGLKQPEIALPNKHVSRNHAKLVILKDGQIELIAGNSENGTFVGDGDAQQRLSPNESRKLNLEDVFWISPAVKLRLEEEQQ